SFVGLVASPIVVVPHVSGSYYEYSAADWNRREMKLRGSSGESARAGWSNSNTAYACIRYSLEHPEDWDDAADADVVFNVDEDASEYLANQANIQIDYLWNAAAGLTGVWTTDWDGVSSSPSTNEFIQFDQAASDPQKTVNQAKEAVFAQIGKMPNTIIAGADVNNELITNSIVRAALQYTQPTFTGDITPQLLARFFGVSGYRVARSFYESAAEGQTSIKANVFGTHDMWLGYVNPTPGKKKISACYTFAFQGSEGQSSENGLFTWKYPDEKIRSDIYGIQMELVVKIVAAGAGAFLEDATA
ncbi:MAG: hypothetical protein ABIH23_07430, partial [bacterium]